MTFVTTLHEEYCCVFSCLKCDHWLVM